MARDFKTFLLRGNVIDLAVAVVMGSAFGALVTALVRDLLTPIIALVAGRHDFGALTFTLRHSVFRYGDFINYLIAFASLAVAVFFLVVKPVSAMLARRHPGAEDDADSRPCTECLSEIPKEARRCAYCTSAQEPLAA